ncbi:hypothetical protein [Spiroplasma endosymbiont of Agriotes lineatus]|uniref:hypothetical protein n=1 Tax=Spiroplasma endosymbiont of Agriotes lineatus TaxID=3077930 RepID=UPI0030CA5D7A
MKKEYWSLTIARISLLLSLIFIIIQYIISLNYVQNKINDIFMNALDSSNLQQHVLAEFKPIQDFFPLMIIVALCLSLSLWIIVITSILFINKKVICFYGPFVLLFLVMLKVILLIMTTFYNEIIVNDLNFFAQSHKWKLTIIKNQFQRILQFNINDIFNIISIILLLFSITILLWMFTFKKQDYSFLLFKNDKKLFSYLKINYKQLSIIS